MRLVIDLIRGRGVDDALNILHFSPKHAAKTAEKVLRSAISNFQNKDEAGRVDTSTLFVREAFVDGGPTMKRIRPAPMGRAYRVRKRSNHITVVIAQREMPATVQTKKDTASAKLASDKEVKEPAMSAAKKEETKRKEKKASTTKKST
jgi:large subunit ribosomal protein L22